MVQDDKSIDRRDPSAIEHRGLNEQDSRHAALELRLDELCYVSGGDSITFAFQKVKVSYGP
jgi:hypothetical protein